jgi:hypothetical protein
MAMPPKRPENHDHDGPAIIENQRLLKRAQVAAWRQASDPVPCDHEAPLMLAWFKGNEMVGEAYSLDDSHMTKRGEMYVSTGTVDSYAIFCPECDLWLAIGEKHGG